MILSNVNIGTGPSSGDGDVLRSAFSIINNNFQKVTNNVNALTNSVTNVAGRTGNVILTVNDIIGLNTVYSTQANVTAANIAMRGYVDYTIAANISALVNAAPATLDTIRELADAIGDDPNFAVNIALSVSSANTKMRSYVDGQITAANAGVVSANLGMKGYVDNGIITANLGMVGYIDNGITTANIGIIGYIDQSNTIQASVITQANLGMKGYVDSVVASQSIYGNANVASFLPTYSGNIKLNEITFNDLSEQTTAWLGSEWRSNLEANLTVKPSWLSFYPGGSKNIFNTSFGFGPTGMFFTGDANYPAYPIRSNFGFHQDDHLEITTTINFVHQGGDNSIAIFNSNVTPAFSFGANVTRIAFDSNFGTPVLGGLITANTAPAPVFFAGNVYTVKFVYDRNTNPSVTVSSFAGNTATGSPIDVRTLNEQLPLGLFTVGFDGDVDNPGQLAYFTDLTIETINNTVVDDLEVQGQITGNLIPSANVIYSLGNITHQWKDLYVSSSTIYLGGTALSVTNGNLTVDGNAVVSIGSDSILSIPAATIFNENVYGGTNNRLYLAGENSEGSPSIDIPNIADGTIYPITIQNQAGGNVEITTAGGTWAFGNIGDLTLPVNGYLNLIGGEIVQAPDNNLIIRVQDAADDGYSLDLVVDDGAEAIQTRVLLDRQQIRFDVDLQGSNYIWTFDNNGNVTFPDSTVQTTAWTGTVDYANVTNGYSNVQVAAYLPTYTGNINASNVTSTTLHITDSTSATGPGQGAVQIDGAVTISGNAFISQSLHISGNIDVNGPAQFGNVIALEYGKILADTTRGIEILDGTATKHIGNISARIDHANEGYIEAPGYEIGYRNIPQVIAGNVTLAIADRGKHYYSTSTAPLTLTVPSNANVAFPIGTAISIVNAGTGNITISKQVEASLYLAGNATSSTRTLTAYGMATILKTSTDQWFINGSGLV